MQKITVVGGKGWGPSFPTAKGTSAGTAVAPVPAMAFFCLRLAAWGREGRSSGSVVRLGGKSF